MGFFGNLKYKGHVTAGKMRKATAGLGRITLASNFMGNKLSSYGLKERWYGQDLNKEYRRYYKLKRIMLHYKPKKKGQISYPLQKIFTKFKDRAQRMRVLVHEVNDFAETYSEILEVVGRIKLDEGELLREETWKVFKNENRMAALVGNAFEIARRNHVAIPDVSFGKLRKDLTKVSKDERRRIQGILKWDKIFMAGKWVGSIWGLHHTIHAVSKLTKKKTNKIAILFDEDLAKLEHAVKSNTISAETFAALPKMVKDFGKVYKHYTALEKDLVLMQSELFDDLFETIFKQCVVPFYSPIQHEEEVKAGVKKILDTYEGLQKAYESMKVTSRQEGGATVKVFQAWNNFAERCKTDAKQIKNINAEAMAALRTEGLKA